MGSDVIWFTPWSSSSPLFSIPLSLLTALSCQHHRPCKIEMQSNVEKQQRMDKSIGNQSNNQLLTDISGRQTVDAHRIKAWTQRWRKCPHLYILPVLPLSFILGRGERDYSSPCFKVLTWYELKSWWVVFSVGVWMCAEKRIRYSSFMFVRVKITTVWAPPPPRIIKKKRKEEEIHRLHIDRMRNHVCIITS